MVTMPMKNQRLWEKLDEIEDLIQELRLDVAVRLRDLQKIHEDFFDGKPITVTRSKTDAECEMGELYALLHRLERAVC